MKKKICTDIKQSKKLVELGLNIDTANLYWSHSTLKLMDDDFDPNVVGHIPSWSLTALLSALPEEINGKGIMYNFIMAHDKEVAKDWLFVYSADKVSIKSGKRSRVKKAKVNEGGKDFIDIVYELVCWSLKKTNILNKYEHE